MRRCEVVLISGFLGSGKTTLLRHLLSQVPDHRRVMVLMNEFGKVGIDGRLVQEGDLQVWEINRGSIFCACAKGDFLRSLFDIARNYAPEVLLVEASGVADTTDMAKDLSRDPLPSMYRMADSVCLIDAARYFDWVEMFQAVPRQIRASRTLVLNKTDLVNEETLDEIKSSLRSFNPEAPIRVASFGHLTWEQVLSGVERPKPSVCGCLMPFRTELAEVQLEAFIEAVLEDGEAHLDPPDRLFSQSIRWTGAPGGFLRVLESLPDDLVRAKGYWADEEGGGRTFDMVGTGAPILGVLQGECDGNLAVFIRKNMDARSIPEIFTREGLNVIEMLV